MRNLLLSLLFVILLVGCTNIQPERSEPITLKEGMKQLAEGLNEFQNIGKDSKKVYGLVPSEIEVTFNISAEKTDGKTANLTISPASLSGVGFGAGWTKEVSSKSGNQITIKFRNLLFSKKGEAFYDDKHIVKKIHDAEETGVVIRK